MLSVVIPNWNGISYLPTCLNALSNQTICDFEVIVVDNASTDGSHEMIESKYPMVRAIGLATNTGFTGACNVGIRAAQGNLVALLNNDTEAADNWLEELVSAFDRHQNAGIIASKLMLFDRRDVFHAAGDLFRSDGTSSNRGVWQKDVGQYGEGYVFSACGGAAGYRREMLNQVGLLDESFFFSLEDVDLAWRAQLQGWKTVYAPSAVVYHRLSATGGGTTASYHDGRNSIYVLIKDVPNSVWRTYWTSILWRQIILAWQALRSWRGKDARARLRGQLAGICAIPILLSRRRMIQSTRKVSSEYIRSILTLV